MRVITNSFFAAILLIAWVAVAVEQTLSPVIPVPDRIGKRLLSYIDRYSFGEGPHSLQEWVEVLLLWAAIALLLIAI